MSLLNYTTKVEASSTIVDIQKCLVANGATAVLNEFDKEGYIISLSFKMEVGGNPISFKLPSDWRPVLQILEDDPKVGQRFCTQEQALRVAWRIILRWIEAQMAFVATGQVKTEQLFLHCAVMRDGKTLSEKIMADPKFLLGAG